VTSAPETRQRRRGQALETAIYDAVLAELGAVGYARLTMEGVAARARSAKSSLYRRWSSLDDLVVAAVHHALPDVATVPDTGDVRDELIAALTLIADTLTGPIGPVVTSILGGIQRSPDLQTAAREQIIAPRVHALQTVFERAAARGEIRAGAATPFVVQTGPAIVIHTCLVRGLPLSTQDIADIVDQVILPAVRPAS
jgi:AcrR family transcriptional regulator